MRSGLSLVLLATLLPTLFAAPAARAEEWIDTGRPAAPVVTPPPARQIPSIFDHATSLADQGQYEAAIAEYQTAIQADPGNIEAYYRLALLYERLRRWDLCASTAEKAFRLDNRNPDVAALWGHALLREARYPESIWVLEGLVRLNSGRSLHAVYYDLGQACFAMKWYDRSIDYTLRHLQAGETPQGHALLARTYLAIGQRDKALAELQRAVGLFENVDDMLR